MAFNISGMADQIVDAFVTLAIGAIIISVVFGLDIAGTSNSTLVSDVETEVNDGMVTVVSIIILIVVFLALRALRARRS